MDDDDTSTPTPYESEQIAAIEDWKNEPPSVVGAALALVAAPAVWLIRIIVPEAAVRGALEGALWAAAQMTDAEDILRDAGVRSIPELRSLPLEKCDRLANSVHEWAIGLATAEGGVTGAVGLPGMVADIPFVITFAIRTIRKIGLCYGYEGDDDVDRAFILNILSASGSNTVKEKLEALATLRMVERLLLKQTWKAMSGKAASAAFSREAAIIMIRNIAKQLGVNITKRKALQAIPYVGAGVGAAMNATLLRDVGWAARRLFQERWLIDNGKLLLDDDERDTAE